MKALPSSALVLLVVASLVGAPVAAQGETTAGGKGERYEAEWKTRSAMDPDYEVVQLTTDDAVDNKMYLDVNPYVPALDAIVFSSTRSDDENLFLMSLDDGTFVQLTDDGGIDADHADVSPATQEAVYAQRQTFKRVSLNAPYREREIRTVADKWDIEGIPSLTSDGKTIAVSLYDDEEERSSLVVIDVATGAMETVKRIDGDVDHVLINPVHGDTLLYHVLDEHEIGIVDIETGARKILTEPGDHGVHPFWAANGVDAAYVEKEHDPQQIVGYDIRKNKYRKYDLPVDGNHFAMNRAQTILQGDGGPNDRYIYYYTIAEDNSLDAERMYKHNSSSEEEAVHPHAAFINNHDLVFNSDADGSGDVYLLRRK